MSDEKSFPPPNMPPQKVFRAHRKLVYDPISVDDIKAYGFDLDADVFEYDESMSKLTSVNLNRKSLISHDSLLKYKVVDGRRMVTEESVSEFTNWLHLWGKMPAFLELRADGDSVTVVSVAKVIQSGTFLGYYHGLVVPKHIDPLSVPLVVKNFAGENMGFLDTENLTYSNFGCLIRKATVNNIELVHRNFGVMIYTCADIPEGQELLLPSV